MIDLTPLDVRKKRGDFRPKLRGYDPEEVDAFLEVAAERMEELVRENLALSESNQRMEGQLRALEGREKAVQDALVTAQKLRDDVQSQSHREAEGVKDQARREAEIVRAQAEAEIQRRLAEAEGLIRERQRALEDLERNRRKFLKGFRSLLEREMDAVEVEEARRPLEDAPLDLNLRGWTPSAPPESSPGAAEPEAGKADSEEGEPEEGDPEEPEAEAPEEAANGPGDGMQEEEAPSEERASGREPLWLSSLLKDDDGEKKLDG